MRPDLMFPSQVNDMFQAMMAGAHEPALCVIDPEFVALHWPYYLRKLGDAIATGSKTPDEVLAAITDKRMELWFVNGAAHGYVVTSVGMPKNSDVLTLWVVYAAGKVSGGPKARTGAILALMAEFEAKARARGCERVRVESARWGRVLPGYTRDGNILEKVL